MDKLIKAMALLISKKTNMTGFSVDDINVLNDVLELARALDAPAPEKEISADMISAIRKGYEEYLIGKLTASYSLVDWFSHTSGRTLTDQQLAAVSQEDDVDLVYGIFSKVCNTVITNARKE
jgi:hypothetical protein